MLLSLLKQEQQLKMVVDISIVNFLTPIAVFILALVIMFAILKKVPLLGDSNVINVIVSVIVAVIFASVSSAREYIRTVTPWFVILVVALFFILFLVSFSLGKFEGMRWIGIVFIVLLAIVFILSAVQVFNLAPYLPGASESGGSDIVLGYKHWLLQDNVLGAALLIIIAAIVVWVVLKK